MSTFARGQANVDYADRPQLSRLRVDRLERVQRLLRDSDLDALLVWKDENVRYLTAHRAQILSGKSALLNGCLLLPDRGPILLSSGGDLERARRTMPWIEEFHAVPIMEARGLVAGVVDETLEPLLRGAGLDSGRLGIDECAYAQIVELGRALPGLQLADGDTLMQLARRIKLPDEIALMEEAAAIAEGVTQAAFDAIAPGVRENEVAAEAMRALYHLGGEMAHVATPFVASGEHMSPPNRLATEKIIRDGDIVFIDIGAMWNGYFGDLGRTTICGRPSRRQQEIYTCVFEALRDATAAMKAGNTNDDVAAAVTAAAERHGLADSFISLFIGHAIGIGSNEPPYIGETLPGAETVVLEEAMTFAVEPLIWVEGVRGGGGVRLEDTIVVEEHGGRALTRTPFDERLLL
jgi:Xaa-Pro aminopeptidase